VDLAEFDYLERLKDPTDVEEDDLPMFTNESASESDPADDEDDEADEQDASKGGPGLASREELFAAYQKAERQLADKVREVEDYRQLLTQMGSDAQHLRMQMEEESFLKEIRDMYQRDPVAATQMMMLKSRQDLREEMEGRIADSLDEHREFNRLMDEFLSRPENSGLKPFRQELEYLIKDKGLHVKEASELLRRIDEKRDRTSRMRSGAAREIRNRSAVETGGEMGEPVDKDKEFYRVMNKAKNLDEMFAGLRKLKA